MKEYVERKYFEDIVDYYLGHSNGAEHYAYGIMRGEVRVAPTADVVEIKHGRWENNEYGYQCSICKGDSLYDGFNHPVKSRSCPHCGAQMDGEQYDA